MYLYIYIIYIWQLLYYCIIVYISLSLSLPLPLSLTSQWNMLETTNPLTVHSSSETPHWASHACSRRTPPCPWGVMRQFSPVPSSNLPTTGNHGEHIIYCHLEYPEQTLLSFLSPGKKTNPMRDQLVVDKKNEWVINYSYFHQTKNCVFIK